jgi:hypothetical protein
MTPEQELEIERLAMDILATVASAIYEEEPEASAARVRKLATRIVRERSTAVNAALEEAAVELDKLQQGTYTSAQTPAGLVRAMKVRG